ncbi:MAG: hypothetical protein CVV55_01590, partial [Synergistetes bacterium HGW-Synergistetes-2]
MPGTGACGPTAEQRGFPWLPGAAPLVFRPQGGYVASLPRGFPPCDSHRFFFGCEQLLPLPHSALLYSVQAIQRIVDRSAARYDKYRLSSFRYHASLVQVRRVGDGVRPEREFRVALCGYYGFGNLGDELLAEALIAALERWGIKRGEMAMFSASPKESARAHGVCSVSRWSPRAVFRILRRSETFLLGGGGLFQDVTSLRSPLYYWGALRLALLAGARPWCAGQSVGPLLTKGGKLLARSALGSCSVRGVRDARSAELLADWGMNSVVTCDPVFSLTPPVTSPRHGSALLVNIRQWAGELARKTAEESARLASSRSLSLTGFALAAEDAGFMEELRRSGVFPAERIVLLDAENWGSECARLFPEADGV